MDIGYYSWGGPNRLKNSLSYYFFDKILFFIAASHLAQAISIYHHEYTTARYVINHIKATYTKSWSKIFVVIDKTDLVLFYRCLTNIFRTKDLRNQPNFKQNPYMLLHTLFTWIKKLLDLKQSITFLHKATKRFLNYFTKKIRSKINYKQPWKRNKV